MKMEIKRRQRIIVKENCTSCLLAGTTMVKLHGNHTSKEAKEMDLTRNGIITGNYKLKPKHQINGHFESWHQNGEVFEKKVIIYIIKK